MSESITIARRFRGPVQSGNGGYVCGVMARALAPGEPAEVTLKAPPPLDIALTLTRSGENAALTHDGAEIATARRAALDIAPPPGVPLDDAKEASTRYSGFAQHIYPECFVCGPRRAQGDGLRIFPGPAGDASIVAASWVPDAQDTDADGFVRSEIVWAALDCPGYFGLMRPGMPALLGRMNAHVTGRARAGEAHVVIGWPLGSDGRKHYGGSAVYAPTGELIGAAKTTWIELRQPAG